MAASTWDALPIGVSAICSPVDGLKTGEVGTELMDCHSPFTNTGTDSCVVVFVIKSFKH